MLAIYVVWRARRENFGASEPFDLQRFLRATGRSLWALGAPFIILGGIYGGVLSNGFSHGTILGMSRRAIFQARLHTVTTSTAVRTRSPP